MPLEPDARPSWPIAVSKRYEAENEPEEQDVQQGIEAILRRVEAGEEERGEKQTEPWLERAADNQLFAEPGRDADGHGAPPAHGRSRPRRYHRLPQRMEEMT